MPAKVLSPQYNRALMDGLKVQIPLFVLSMLVLDSGAMFRAYILALLCQIMTVALIAARRPRDPSRFDLGLVRYGIIPLFLVSYGSHVGLLWLNWRPREMLDVLWGAPPRVSTPPIIRFGIEGSRAGA